MAACSACVAVAVIHAAYGMAAAVIAIAAGPSQDPTVTPSMVAPTAAALECNSPARVSQDAAAANIGAGPGPMYIRPELTSGGSAAKSTNTLATSPLQTRPKAATSPPPTPPPTARGRPTPKTLRRQQESRRPPERLRRKIRQRRQHSSPIRWPPADRQRPRRLPLRATRAMGYLTLSNVGNPVDGVGWAAFRIPSDFSVGRHGNHGHLAM